MGERVTTDFVDEETESQSRCVTYLMQADLGPNKRSIPQSQKNPGK